MGERLTGTVDPRGLAERLGVLLPCHVCCEGRLVDCASPGEHDQCFVCEGTSRRLPTEAEVRAAIFETGIHWVEVGASLTSAHVSFGGDENWRVHVEHFVPVPSGLVLLALLRALETCRG